MKPAVAGATNLTFDFKIQLYQGESIVGGKDVKFSDLFSDGRPVILNFWAGLCPPCRLEMPDFEKFHTEYQSQASLIGLDIGPYVGLGSQEDGKALLRELGISYPAGSMSASSVVARYRVLGMPTTLFMTPDGAVFQRWTGILTQDKLPELTEELLKASEG